MFIYPKGQKCLHTFQHKLTILSKLYRQVDYFRQTDHPDSGFNSKSQETLLAEQNKEISYIVC